MDQSPPTPSGYITGPKEINTQASTKSGNRHRDEEVVSQVVVRFPRKTRRVVKSGLIIMINITLIIKVVKKPEDL